MVLSMPFPGPDLTSVSDLSIINDHSTPHSGPFEGPEKLLEIWFAPSKDELPAPPTEGPGIELSGRPEFSSGDSNTQKLTGLRTISLHVWHEMLDLVKCKVLSTIQGEKVDAYLLSESSMFVWPHKIILKTCGTTTLLFGLTRLLKIAEEGCGFPGVWRLFYSRKSYMFPERQIGLHQNWPKETAFMDGLFKDSSAYTIGPTNGNHWFLYLTAPQHQPLATNALLESSIENGLLVAPRINQNSVPMLTDQRAKAWVEKDCTLEILMTGLSHEASQKFYVSDANSAEGSMAGNELATHLEIDAASLIGSGKTDAYLFSPCGFSANMVGGSDKERYATIHVTPEETHSFASFESNVDYSDPKGPLSNVVSRVMKVFEPSKVSMTLFKSHVNGESHDSNAEIVKTVEHHHPKGYNRVDQIVYHFVGYDLIFLSFERPQVSHSKP